MLLNYAWPGNVRELENVIQRGMVLTRTNMIEREHLPGNMGSMGRRFDDKLAVTDESVTESCAKRDGSKTHSKSDA